MTDQEMQIIEEAAKSGYASIRAEQNVVGSMVADFDRCAHLLAELTDEDFFFASTKAVLCATKRAKAEGLAVDLITVDQEMTKLYGTTQAKDYTTHLIDWTTEATPWNIESHCRIVKELAARRRALAMIRKVQNDLLNPSNDINAVVDTITTGVGSLIVGKHKWVPVSEILAASYTHLSNRAKGKIKSIESGIRILDTVTGGFFGGELTVVGARPGVGKSVFGMNAAIAAAKQGYHVGIVSREMTDIQYGQRILSYASGVDGGRIRRATVTEDDWVSMGHILSQAGRLPMDFLFSVRTVEDLRAEVQLKKNRGEMDLLVVDYLQLMDTASTYKEDRLRVGHISKALKDIAVDLNIPVIALAQVKRYAGGSRAKMPTLEDLKDSGSIEQDADNVIFLHPPYDESDEYIDPRDREYFRNYQSQGYTYLCIGIAKQRQGETGKCCVLFDKSRMRYLGIDRTGDGERR